MRIKVLSWNIWIDGYFDRVSDFLERAGADIVGLQEVKADDPKRDVISVMKRLGYDAVFAPVTKSWGGNTYKDGPAIFSRHHIVSSVTHLLSKEDSRAVAQADIMIGTDLLHVASTHLIHTHQQDSAVQNEQAENLLARVSPSHSIVMGDFNAAPTSTPIRMMRKHFSDTDPADSPTWSVYPEGCSVCKPTRIDTRLDYIFISPDLTFDRFTVEESRASDHLPISVYVEV